MKVRLLFRAIRPTHWIKNLVLFAALVFDGKMFDPHYFSRAFAGFVMFCMLASSIYLLNDVADKERDRIHPQKRRRPVASGELSKTAAVATALIVAIIAIAISYQLNIWVGWLSTIYLLQNIAYSFHLKKLVIVDVFLIAAGFMLRVATGAALVDVEQGPLGSPWVYMCVGLATLFVALGKRRAELVNLEADLTSSDLAPAKYTQQFLDQMIVSVSASTIIAYSLYTFNAPNLAPNHLMMLTIPIVIHGIFRYLYLILVMGHGGLPHRLFFTDRPLLATVLLWGIAVVAIMYWA